MSLSVAPETRIPLKQLSAAVTCSTRTWLLPGDSNIPIRAKFRTKPGPKITTLLWLAVVIPSSGSKGAGKWVQLVGGFACPVMVKPFSLNVISGAPNLMHGALLTVQVTSPTSSLSSMIIRVEGIVPLISSAGVGLGQTTRAEKAKTARVIRLERSWFIGPPYAVVKVAI